MSRIIFAPTIPTITVDKIGDTEELQSVVKLMKRAPESFVGFSEKEINSIHIKDHVAYIMTSGNVWEHVAIASVGDYLVESENGKRFVTTDRLVRHGIFSSLPMELFTPLEGTRTTFK